jgi:hypothetical protein
LKLEVLNHWHWQVLGQGALVWFVVLVVVGLMHFQIQHLMSMETTHLTEGLSYVAYLKIVS